MYFKKYYYRGKAAKRAVSCGSAILSPAAAGLCCKWAISPAGGGSAFESQLIASVHYILVLLHLISVHHPPPPPPPPPPPHPPPPLSFLFFLLHPPPPTPTSTPTFFFHCQFLWNDSSLTHDQTLVLGKKPIWAAAGISDEPFSVIPNKYQLAF